MFEVVVLKRDIPEKAVNKGEIGTIIEEYNEYFFEVEFYDNHGETYNMQVINKEDFDIIQLE